MSLKDQPHHAGHFACRSAVQSYRTGPCQAVLQVWTATTSSRGQLRVRGRAALLLMQAASGRELIPRAFIAIPSRKPAGRGCREGTQSSPPLHCPISSQQNQKKKGQVAKGKISGVGRSRESFETQGTDPGLLVHSRCEAAAEQEILLLSSSFTPLSAEQIQTLLPSTDTSL